MTTMRFDKLSEEQKSRFTTYVSNHTNKETAERFNISIATVQNWARKLKIPLKSFRYRNYDEHLLKDSVAYQTIIGSLLYDGSLTMHQPRYNSLFTVSHQTPHKEYLQWKAKVTSKWLGKVAGLRNSVRMRTIAHRDFTRLEKSWYLRDSHNQYEFNNHGQRIKVVPRNLTLTPIIVSVWYYDDGTNDKQSRRISIATDSFCKDDCLFLVSQLKAMGFVQSRVRIKTKKCGRWLIKIYGKSYFDFIDCVKHCLPIGCMSYKTSYQYPDYSTQFQPKLSQNDKQQIKQLYKSGDLTQTSIAHKYDVSQSTISLIVKQ